MKLAIPVALASLLLVSFAQERVKPKGPADFTKALKSVGAQWEAKKYGACIRELNTCLELATAERSKAIFESLPSNIDNWTSPKRKTVDAGNPFGAALTGAVGNIIERTYNETGGRKRIDVTVTADSPLVGMLGMVIANPAADPEAEAIKYGEHKALLKAMGSGKQLQILIHGKHVVEVRTNFEGEDILFRFFDQAAVDRLAAALEN